MLVLKGKLINVYHTPKKTTQDGKEYGGKDRLQVLDQVSLDNKETKSELVEITCHDSSCWKGHAQSDVEIPVEAFARGSQIYYRTDHVPTPPKA